METTYRLKVKDIGMSFFKSLKTLFEGQEVEIIVRSIDPKKRRPSEGTNKSLLHMIKDNRQNAPVISPYIDIRDFIDDTHNPENS